MALPELWGPTAWRILHGASFDADAGSFARLVDVLQRVLPCPHCRTSFQYYCRDVPLACMDPALDPLAVAKWCWRLHDSVNRKLAKWPRLPFSSLQRRHAVFGLTVASDDAFGLPLPPLPIAEGREESGAGRRGRQEDDELLSSISKPSSAAEARGSARARAP